jgi:protoporphyrinogen oxidase
VRVAIIGAGAAGLAAAYDVSLAGHAVKVYEAAAQVGGLAAGFTEPHWSWTLEKFYHHWFESDRAILGLIDELGWRERVQFRRSTTLVYHEGSFHPFDSAAAMLWFLLLHCSAADAARFALVGAYLRFSRHWEPLEHVTAVEWTRRWFGERVYRVLWQPLLLSKFGKRHYARVNMAWLWARLHSRTTRLGTFAGGFQAFLDALADRVRAQGGRVHVRLPVTAITSGAGHTLSVQAPDGTAEFDAVLSTSSPALTARMARNMPFPYAQSLRALESLGALVLVVTLDRALTAHYWHCLSKEDGFPFLALVEHTNLVSAEHYGGDHVIYCGDYLDPDDPLLALDRDAVLARYLPALARVNPEFDPRWIRGTWLWRTPYAQPIPLVGHSRNVPTIRTPVPGLYVASMSQVYPWDRGTNYAVEIGRRAARTIVADLASSAARRPASGVRVARAG